MFVKVLNNIVEKYPYSVEQFRAENPNISFPENIDNITLSEFGVFPVSLIERPIYNKLTQYIVENNPILIDLNWTQKWEVVPLSQEQIDHMQKIILEDYDAFLSNYFDIKARERGYNSRITCAMRAGYPGPYQAECTIFAQWMDSCSSQFYYQLEESISNLNLLSKEELVSNFPTLNW